jgi:hypothetical protein
VNERAIFEMLPSAAIYAIPIAVGAMLAILVLRGWLIRRSVRTKDRVARAYSRGAPEDDVETIARRIGRAASASGDKSELAPLYLALAREHEKRGDEEARMSALRSAAGCGALHGSEAAHAAARMQLAEAAYASGDLTSACEHWHLARGAYLACGQMDEHARVEKRMRDNGCPTDWVLTDF